MVAMASQDIKDIATREESLSENSMNDLDSTSGTLPSLPLTLNSLSAGAPVPKDMRAEARRKLKEQLEKAGISSSLSAVGTSVSEKNVSHSRHATLSPKEISSLFAQAVMHEFRNSTRKSLSKSIDTNIFGSGHFAIRQRIESLDRMRNFMVQQSDNDILMMWLNDVIGNAYESAASTTSRRQSLNAIERHQSEEGKPSPRSQNVQLVLIYAVLMCRTSTDILVEKREEEIPSGMRF